MIKSVDPDETTSGTEKKNEPDDVLVSHNRDLHEEGMEGDGEEVEEDQEGETSSPAPVILEDNRTVPNHTGNISTLHIHTRNCLDCCPSPWAKRTDASDIIIFKTAQLSPPQIYSV